MYVGEYVTQIRKSTLMHTAHILMEPARVSQVEMQFSQCFLSVPGRRVVTAGRIILATAETARHDQS